MRIHSRSQRFIERGADHPQIDVNIELDKPDPHTKKKEVHYAAIRVAGAELCDLAERVLDFCNVPIGDYH